MTSGPPVDHAPHPADRDASASTAVAKPTASAVAMPTAAAPVAIGETASSAIAAREKAAVEARFLVARGRPRDFEESRMRLLKACARPLFAAGARYAKPVGGGKPVTGLSIRFAEEARVLWGNIDVTAMVVSDTEDRRIYRVTGIDLETNAGDMVDVVIEKFVERKQLRAGMEVIGSRKNTQGEIVHRIRATEDDLTVKVNNMIAKAKRNVILALIPGDVKEECERAVIDTVTAKDKADPDGARRDLLQAFFDYGIMPAQIIELLGHPVESISPAELAMLRNYYTALKGNEGTTWADILEAHGKRGATASTTEADKTTGAQTSSAPGTEGLKGRVASAATKTGTAKTAAPEGDACEFCGEKGGKHKPDCESLK